MKLTPKEFRKRIVAGSFPEYSNLATALTEMRFVQADPIRSPARAQDLILRQRVIGYKAGDLEQQFPCLDAEEGYLFAYGFMRPDVWRDLRPAKAPKLKSMERQVLSVVKELGEVHPRDLAERFGKRSITNYWGGKSQMTKRILEDLHDQGLLRVSRRDKGVRVYQLPSLVESPPTPQKQRFARLALTTAQVFGPVNRSFLLSELKSLNHLLPQRAARLTVVEELVTSGQLSEIEVDGRHYLWIQDAWANDEVKDRVRILAPFDPLVRDRQRFEQLWGWNYRFEAYVPAAKRQRGYYAMPLLWRENVIGWANAKVQGKRLRLDLGCIGKRPRQKAFHQALETEAEALARFLGLESGS